MRENKRATPRQDEVVEREEKKRRGWVSNRFACMQDVHYKRCDRYLVASAIEEERNYSVTKFLVGDSLVFDFGETQAVQDYCRQIGGVKVRIDECAHP